MGMGSTMGTTGAKAPEGAGVSRRQFMRGGVAAGAAAGMAAMASAVGFVVAVPASDDGTWNEQADVVVAGAGGAGLVAGMVAARNGASVILIDSAANVGGNTNNSSGVIQTAGTDVQKQVAGIEDDTPEARAEFYLAAGEGQLDEELVCTICDDAPACISFMQDLGVVYDTVYGQRYHPQRRPRGAGVPHPHGHRYQRRWPGRRRLARRGA